MQSLVLHFPEGSTFDIFPGTGTPLKLQYSSWTFPIIRLSLPTVFSLWGNVPDGYFLTPHSSQDCEGDLISRGRVDRFSKLSSLNRHDAITFRSGFNSE